jgi:hypothetical protein
MNINTDIDPIMAEENDKPEEPIKKEAKKFEPKPKYYYDVKVECMLPAILTYRVLAEDPQQAAELIRGKSPNTVKHQLIGRKELMLKVYDASGCMIRFMKRLMGG